MLNSNFGYMWGEGEMREKELLEPIGIWSKKGMGVTAEVKAFAELRMIAKVKPTVLIRCNSELSKPSKVTIYL